ncbi:MAG: efflux RND transporter periplasmic adaptor subunit, partial [Armatimonadota bacterium]
GQVVVRLESDDLRAEVERASAGLGSAEAALSQARVALDLQRTRSDVDVQQAEAALKAARANLAKVRAGPRPQEREQLAQNVEAAKAALQRAQEQLSLAREGARRQEKAQAAEAVRQAESALRTAEADLKRIKSLNEQGAASQQQLDHAQLRYDSAKAQLEQARQQLDMVREGSRTQEVRAAEAVVQQAEANYKAAQEALAMADEGGRAEDVRAAEAQVRQAQEALRMAKASVARDRLRAEDVKNAEAAVAQARARLRAANVQLGYATIRAPISGIVTARYVDPGDMASPGTPLLRIEDDSSYRLEALVPARDVAALGVGDEVTVELDALRETLRGRVALIVPSADPASRTVLVKVDLPRTPGLASGMFGRIKFQRGKERLVVIPREAVTDQAGVKSVFTVDPEGRARLRLITLGRTFDGEVEVLSGLQDGDRIVVSPSDEVQDGSLIASEGGGPS